MKNLFILLISAFTFSAFAAETLTINAAEFGIGKFHRKDNKEHEYEATNAWKVFVLPDGAATDRALVRENAKNDYTIFFTSLQELMEQTVALVQKTGKKVGLINLNAHGLPGGMWFPKNPATRDSEECKSWRDAASHSDDDNYNQYYSTVSKSEILSFHEMANASSIPSFECLTGLKEWTEIAKKVPAFKKSFATTAQIHMHSCLVGLGGLGEKYTNGLAKLLFASGTQRVMTSLKFGLGDWSMPDGMGFWDYESDEQLARDNANYPVSRRDADMAQRGDIRVAERSGKTLRAGLIQEQDFLLLSHDDRSVTVVNGGKSLQFATVMPKSVRVPGTQAVLRLK